MTSKWISSALATVLAAAFFLQVHIGSLEKSLTWDEPVYIAAGYTYLQWDSFHLNPSHPPLLQYLAAVPLLFLKPQLPAAHPALDPNNRANVIVDFAKEFIFHPANDVERIAYWARLSRHILGTLLILAIYLWGKRLYGEGPALFSTAFAAFCPNLIAHSKLATEDLGCTTLMFLSVWALWRSIHSRGIGWWAVCGFTTGLALASKYTALLLGPIFVLLMLVAWLKNPADRQFPRDLLHIGTLSFFALFVVGATYDLSFDYTLYIGGLEEIYQDLHPNLWFYLLGETYEEPKWYYFVVAGLMKTPLPTLVLFGAAALSAIRDHEHREAQLFLLIPAATVIGASFFDATNSGLRRILPAFPFLLLFTAQSLVGRFSQIRFTAAAILLALTMASTLWVYPHHLSYFNEAVGGPERGPYLLNDSNLDWGQDLPALAAWQRANPEATPVRLRYFGLADPDSYGISWIPLSKDEVLRPNPGFYAMSAHVLTYLRRIRHVTGLDVDWLDKYEPIGRAGYSIYLYRFPPKPKGSRERR